MGGRNEHEKALEVVGHGWLQLRRGSIMAGGGAKENVAQGALGGVLGLQLPSLGPMWPGRSGRRRCATQARRAFSENGRHCSFVSVNPNEPDSVT